MLPNPFQKPLPEFKDTDPLKNREIVRELLGEGGVHKYRKILGDISDPHPNRQKEVTKEDLIAMAAEARSQIDALSRDASKPIIEKIIEKEYTFQINSLKKIGFLENEKKRFSFLRKNKLSDLGFTAIDEKFYKIPSQESIVTYFSSIPDIKRKTDQGFTRLLIVPFGMPLDTLTEKTQTFFEERRKAGRIFAPNGSKVTIPRAANVIYAEDYFDADRKGSLVYYPQLSSGAFIGSTKAQVLSGASDQLPFPGYHVLLIHENQVIPEAGKGVTLGGRLDLEAGMSAEDYLEILTTDSVYAQEHGLTPEDWLTLFATNLNQTNIMLGLSSGWSANGMIHLLIAARLTSEFDKIPTANIVLGNLDASAYLSVAYPFHSLSSLGIKTAVG